MRVCIFGAGAIGGYLGAELAASDVDVTLIARGPHLEAMQRDGLKLLIGGEQRIIHPTCTSDPTEAGPQDYVIITLKAHSVPGIVETIQPLIGPDTTVVTAVNGIPWWYFHGLEGRWRDHRLESIDPGGVQWDRIGPERVLGCIVYPACDMPAPGVIQHVEGNRFSLGEPSGERSGRATRLSEAFIAAGLKAPVRPRIRDEIWIKLWGNLCFNPISALTHAMLDEVATDPGTRAVSRDMMVEAQAVGEALGIKFNIDVEKRLDAAAAVGPHKTSMLQDLEKGRPMEIDALLTSVQELARLTAIASPTIDTVLALIQQRARMAGVY
ncbi:MAG: 2-dehydropantoate 2-reductase [Alphaproteobacteria bacterium]